MLKANDIKLLILFQNTTGCLVIPVGLMSDSMPLPVNDTISQPSAASRSQSRVVKN